MTDALTVFGRFEVVPEWKWRSADAGLHRPADMETRHLFYTLRMIWNHSMPEHMRVGQNIRLYRFPPHYSAGYMKQAIYHVGHELMRRDDVEPWQRYELEQMAAWLCKSVGLSHFQPTQALPPG